MKHETTMCSVRTLAFGDKSVPLWGLGDNAASLGTVPEVWGQLAPMSTDAYSEDMRWRVVWQHDAMGKSAEDIAKNLCVDKSTIYRTLKHFHETGEVRKRPYPERSFIKLTNPAKLLILQLVIDNPGIYLREIKTELMDLLAISVDVSTICKYLSKSGFTRQKLQIKALQQDKFLRQKYILDVSSFSSNTLIFVDETGADTRNFIRKYGYSRRGKPLQSHKMLVRGERVSAIACMSVAGLLDVKMVKGTTDGDEFYDFIKLTYYPSLMAESSLSCNFR